MGEEEKKEKKMLLAFQSDDSTGFTKRLQHRRHLRATGENGCMCSSSLNACVQTASPFECEYKNVFLFVLWESFQVLNLETVGGT